METKNKHESLPVYYLRQIPFMPAFLRCLYRLVRNQFGKILIESSLSDQFRWDNIDSYFNVRCNIAIFNKNASYNRTLIMMLELLSFRQFSTKLGYSFKFADVIWGFVIREPKA